MKLWFDDTRPAPEGYIWLKSVNQGIYFIRAFRALKNNKPFLFGEAINSLKKAGGPKLTKADFVPLSIELISLDHDAGSFANKGGDYIKFLDYLVEVTYASSQLIPTDFPVAFHTMNPVGRDNMKIVAERNGFPIKNPEYKI